MKTARMVCTRVAIMMLALEMVEPAQQLQAQQTGLPPLPPGYVYQVISNRNTAGGIILTAEELNLPPLPPGLAFGVVPKPKEGVEIVPELFLSHPVRPAISATALEEGVKRRRTAPLNPTWNSNRAGKFVMNLFEDATYTAIIERVEAVGSSTVRFCRLEGIQQSRLIIAEQNGVVVGSLIVPGRNSFAVRYGGNGFQTITELKPARAKPANPPCEVDLRVPSKRVESAIAAQETAGVTTLEDAGPPIIDIMVIYTPATAAAHGGPAGVSALAALAVAEVNDLFDNSLINARLRLIHEQQIEYTESGDSNLQTDYDRLVDQNDGFMDQVPPLGEAWGADLISLWLTHPNATHSRGEALTQVTPSKYSVVIARNAVSTGSPEPWHFAHELGHNLGCDHSWIDNHGPNWRYFENSLGNWQICSEEPCGPNGYYSDIMAFYISMDLLPVYSNPVVYYYPGSGDPCPTGLPPESSCPCDCAGTINVTAGIVAAYKTATFLIYPTFDRNVPTFSFQIQGPPNSQCKIESSSDLVQWTVRQTVTLSGTGTAAFTDNGVGSVSARFYRATP